jgi:hypothetical protein
MYYLIGEELSSVLKAKQQVAESFNTKDLGVAYHFLGFLIHRDEFGIRLSQEQYTKVVLERFVKENSHAKRTPFNEGTSSACAVRCQWNHAEQKKQHLKDTSNACTCAPYAAQEVDFAALVGAAMFLATRSRPDIALRFASSLGVLSRFVPALKAFHEPLLKHLLRYLRGTLDWGLWCPSGTYPAECSQKIPKHMLLYTDADHCGEEKKTRTSGWVVQPYGCTVAWGSKLQATAVKSTCAAEFVATCIGKNSAMSLKDLLFETIGKVIAAELLVDNQNAVEKLTRPSGPNMWLDLTWRVVH